MKIEEVNNAALAQEFIHFPIRLYKNEKRWIRPLDKDIEAVFDRSKNKKFRDGDCIRWVLKDNDGETLGRIAAFFDNKSKNKNNDQPTGGVGFFECINDQSAANLLFDTSKAWLEQKGLEAMDGPINFGERDRWWGCLIEGFDIEPNYCCNYNFPYYSNLFENYAFKTYFKQYTYSRKVLDPVSGRYQEKADYITNDPKFHVTHMDKKKLDTYTRYFVDIYNKAWSGHKGVPKLQYNTARLMMKQMKPIMDEKIMVFAFYDNEPIGFFISLPEVNQIFKYVNGKLDWIGKIKFLWHQWRRTNKKMYGVVFGVVPEFHRRGVDGAMIVYARNILHYKHKRYNYLEMNWIGDFNPKMINMIKHLDTEVSKTHITYRKLFDESRPFKRHPILN
ncbi:MAG TPA: hypothetical protein DDY13_18295 [Cytophagales bacterium]|jgi:hypothetical protein|nr:hypothetical protein [Cytophagales bacterium]